MEKNTLNNILRRKTKDHLIQIVNTDKTIFIKYSNTFELSTPLHSKFFHKPPLAKNTCLAEKQSNNTPFRTSYFLSSRTGKNNQQLSKIYQKRTEVDLICRFCYEHLETTQHILSACSVLTRTDFIKRHNKMGEDVYQKASKAANIIHSKNKEIPL